MFFLNIDLSKLRNTEFHEREIEGKVEKCISIPIESNGLVIRGRKEVHLYALMKERKPNPDGITHTVVPYITSKKLFAELISNGWWKSMYYLGKVSKKYQRNLNNPFYNNNNSVSLDEAMEKD